MVASPADEVRSLPPCPHCDGDVQINKAENTRYLLCLDCGLVRVLPFAALNPNTSLLGPRYGSTAV